MTRRYLVDPRFQLKYTGLLVGVVLAVIAALGVAVLRTSAAASSQAANASLQAERALKEAATSARLLKSSAAEYTDIGPELQKSLEADLAAIDREHQKNLADVIAQRNEVDRNQRRMVVVLIVGSAALLGILAFLGIYITHHIVGPVYRMKRLLRQVGTGRFSVADRLRMRKGDELEDLFDTFVQMTHSLEELQAGRRATLEATMDKAERAAVPADVMSGLQALHAQMSIGLAHREKTAASLGKGAR